MSKIARYRTILMMDASVVIGLAGIAHATSCYVAANGSDSNTGTATATVTPFLTLQRAANATQPGDTVYVIAGTYTAPCAGCDVVENPAVRNVILTDHLHR